MSCITIRVTKIGGIVTKASRIGGMAVNVAKIDGIRTNVERVGGMALNVARVGGMKCNVYPVCSVDMRGNFLDIAPKIVWIWNDPVENDVYSNTNWIVE